MFVTDVADGNRRRATRTNRGGTSNLKRHCFFVRVHQTQTTVSNMSRLEGFAVLNFADASGEKLRCLCVP